MPNDTRCSAKTVCSTRYRLGPDVEKLEEQCRQRHHQERGRGDQGPRRLPAGDLLRRLAVIPDDELRHRPRLLVVAHTHAIQVEREEQREEHHQHRQEEPQRCDVARTTAPVCQAPRISSVRGVDVLSGSHLAIRMTAPYTRPR